jgi:hypothetical protein
MRCLEINPHHPEADAILLRIAQATPGPIEP